MRTFTHYVVLLLTIAAALLTVVSCGNSYTGEDEPYVTCEVNVRTFLNVREQPSAQSAIITRVYGGDSLRVLGIDGEWAEVRLDDRSRGYAAVRYLTPRTNHGAIMAEVDENGEYVDPAAVAAQSEAIKEEQKLRAERRKAEEERGMLSSLEVRDSAGVLTREDFETLQSAITQGGLDLTVVTLDSVAPDNVFGIADEVNADIVRERNGKDSRGWLKRLWHTCADNFYYEPYKGYRRFQPEQYTIVYVEDCRLMSVAGEGASMTVLDNIEMERYFAAQEKALNDSTQGLIAMVETLARARKAYGDLPWYKRTQLSTANVFDYLADEVFVENILPNDSWLHKWLFGWLFAIPFALATRATVAFGSFTLSLIAMGLFYLLFKWFTLHCNSKLLSKQKAGCASQMFVIALKIVRIGFWMTLLAMIVYVIPDAANVVSMTVNHYPADAVTSLIRQYAHQPLERSWLLIILFIIGSALRAALNPDLVAASTLGPNVQRSLLSQVRDSNAFAIQFAGWQLDKSVEEYAQADAPFGDMFTDYAASKAGEFLVKTLFLAFIFNASFMFFAAIFMWIDIAARCLQIIYIKKNYRHAGYR